VLEAVSSSIKWETEEHRRMWGEDDVIGGWRGMRAKALECGSIRNSSSMRGIESKDESIGAYWQHGSGFGLVVSSHLSVRRV